MALHEFTLGRQEEVPRVTDPSAFRPFRRFPILFPLTTMQLIKTLIPLFQPGGTLQVPAEDWEALNRFVSSRHGGHLHVREQTANGFLVAGDSTRGLPCYELSIEVSDEIDIADVVNGEFDVKLKETVARNIHTVRVPQSA